MPPQAGEETLATVFADVHYFFSPRDYKPLHHRFDKGSYVYVHYGSASGRGRIEVANNAGTPEQDAVAGALESAHITYSYNKPTFVSINLASGASQPTTSKPWQLPGYDLRNERKYMYNLNSVDLYLWNPEDAIDMVEALSRVSSIGALDVQDAPRPGSQDDQVDPGNATLSPVVQQLEQVAISPQYQRASTSTTQSIPLQTNTSHSTHGTQASADAAAAFAPMPYNPAAPAAPETRVDREKTPPPPDGEVGIGMRVGPQQQSPPGGYPYGGQPLTSAGTQQQPFYGASSPPHTQPQQQQQAPQFAAPPTQYQGRQQNMPMGQSGPAAQQAPTFAAPPVAPTQQTSTSPPIAQPPPQTSTSAPPQHPSYSSYSYTSAQQTTQPAHNIHQQFYVPTKEEAGRIPASRLPAHALQPGQTSQNPAQPVSSTTGRVSRVESGVNKLFKKLEKF